MPRSHGPVLPTRCWFTPDKTIIYVPVNINDVSSDRNRSTILVVDDEVKTAEGYAQLLKPEYAVRVATSGSEAITALDDSIDVVLLDRRMPGISGEEVLEVISERDLECRVALVTAVSPDFDILEFGIDDYLQKPVDADDLEATVEKLLALDEYERLQRELSSTRVKRNVLELEKDDPELASNPVFQELLERIESLQNEIDAIEAEYSLHFES